MADAVDWNALAAEMTANFLATGQWFAGPASPATPPAPVTDWNALAAAVTANFLATGQWFLGDAGVPGSGGTDVPGGGGTGIPGGTITRASTSASGEQGNGDSSGGRLSPDGAKVAFSSFATNLVPGDTNGALDTFVKDLATGAIVLASTPASGEQGNGDSFGGLLFADGAKVAFQSSATDLVPGDTNGALDIFVEDLATGAIVLASTSASGEQGNGDSFGPWLSADGAKVAFSSSATNLVPGDTNGTEDIFVKDLATGAISRASTLASGEQANAGSFNPSLSADGTKVAFVSAAGNLVPGETMSGIFVKDLTTGAISRANASASGELANSGSFEPSLSADGTRVAFLSSATNLVPGDTNGALDTFVKDLATGAIVLASTSASGELANNNTASSRPFLSADGTVVAFASTATNLVPGDTNGASDVFVRDLSDLFALG